ncbi:aspartate aminotransferase family protein [Chondromyces apiculatus]|uniref:Acetylornithine and succinylornithine aminotransferase n=1 Tax=Chondromyces apiculatus DSM 436 TaxID=1192034 RepID=A0A017SZD6_9BACT|nr:aspartate aminotransferase family protein [Chondromyces apiculatus]EYF02338.1 acetylornithine and succinylornithine aminotransferase [Chondromyces apiculatus DSM 436]
MQSTELPRPTADAPGDLPPQVVVPPPGPLSRAAALRLEQVECPAFGRRRDSRASITGAEMLPIVLSSGRGANVNDVDGNRYVDLCAGFGALLLGHTPPPVQHAVEAQLGRLALALGDVYSADTKIGLLERLASLHPGQAPKVLLGQSGSDGVTAAIKTAALATGRPGLLAFEGAYHGLGYAPLPACGLRESYRSPFQAQLNPHVVFAPYPRGPDDEAGTARTLDMMERSLRGGEIGAVVLEPLLGRGGCVVPPDAFLHGACEVAHRHGALVIADEIWTGLGRTGAMARSIALGAAVDILCFGKGLGGGLPISACIAPEAIMASWSAGIEVIHTSTHSGSPLACAAALAVLDALQDGALPARAQAVGARWVEELRTALSSCPSVVDVRGVGLMVGVELESAALGLRVMRGMLDQGYLVLTGGTQGEVLTFTPALGIPEALLSGATMALQHVLQDQAHLA